MNYSLLKAILENIITDEDISIIECDKLYRKFWFRFVPKTITTGQKCIYMIYKKIKSSKNFNLIYEESENEERKKEGYCEISFEGLVYDFEEYDEEQINNDNINQILKEREVERILPRTEFYQKKIEAPKKEEKQDKMQLEKEQIRKSGNITTNFDVLISLIQEIIKNCEEAKEELNEKIKAYTVEEKEAFFSPYEKEKRKVEEYDENIDEQIRRILELRKMKEKRVLANEEIRNLLIITNLTYKELKIKNNDWKILPLEDVKVHSAYTPLKFKVVKKAQWSFEEEKIEYYYRDDFMPLIKKYENDFKDLGIDIKIKVEDKFCSSLEKYVKHLELKSVGIFKREFYYTIHKFKIGINLADISDLPIDYEKVELIPEEKMKEIIEGEKEIDR